MTYYDLNMNSKRINNTQDPASAQDVATKNYVDSKVGLTLVASGTFTSVSNIILDNVFSSTYENYLLTIRIFAVSGIGGGINLCLRMRAGGVSDTGANYNIQYGPSAVGSTVSASRASNQTSLNYVATTTSTTTVNTSKTEIYNPYLAEATKFISQGNNVYSNSYNTNFQIDALGGNHQLNTSYDGMELFCVSSNPSPLVSGSYKLYGYA